LPPLGDTVVGLIKGKVSAKAVQTNSGWHIVRQDDMRKFKLPTFDESKNIISQSFLNRRKQEAISALMKKATVVPAK
jgi:peptidyl-prolyl cis-trans isomerase C